MKVVNMGSPLHAQSLDIQSLVGFISAGLPAQHMPSTQEEHTRLATELARSKAFLRY